jgi:hypothetical protein
VQNDNTLTQAIQEADLPAMVARHFPDSRAVPNKAGRIIPTWEKRSRDFNASLKRYPDGTWRLHDFVTNQDFNAFGFLVSIVGMTKADAAKYLIQLAGLEERSTQPRAKPQPRIEPKPVPEMPKDLTEWIGVWNRFGGVQLGLEGAKLEGLKVLSNWLADALRPYKAQLERIAVGTTLEHCIDAFMGVTPRVCPCRKRWTTKMEMHNHDDNGKHFLTTSFGCEPCGEIWTASELETARAINQTTQQPHSVSKLAFDPLAKYRRKMAQLRGAR